MIYFVKVINDIVAMSLYIEKNEKYLLILMSIQYKMADNNN